ncbi:MAG: GntR family transcriptional regulator [Deltaproteobacteria bacterium]|nr:GntR family transcriptional regulator [Deltaproteobacteria bacterium]
MLRNEAIPLYYQLETILRKRIVSGELARGEFLPSEEALAKKYNLSRITVRQAFSSLESDGLIVRKRGKGTFVSKKHTYLESPKFTGFIEDLISMGIHTKSKILNISMVEGRQTIREHLELGVETKLFRIEKIRLVEGSPFSYVLNYLPPDIGKKIKTDDLIDKPLLMILEDDLGIKATEAIQSIAATIADTHVAALLGIRVGDPLLKGERTVFDVNHKPVEYVSVLYRADKYFYTVNLKRKRSKNFKGWGPV